MTIGIATQWVRATRSTMVYTNIAGTGHMTKKCCVTIDNKPFCACLHAWDYITESCYNSLTESEKLSARSCHGMVTDTGWAKPYKAGDHTYYTFDPAAIVECWSAACSALRPDPCKDVSCPDKCVGVDKYDQVCQDGICVRGTLIETNSEHCGYTPEPEPDPTPTPSSDTYIVIALMLAGTYLVLRR